MTGRIGLRLVLALIGTTLTLLCWAQPARAHTSLVESDPPDRARLSDPPPSVRLRFSEPIDPASVTLRVLDVGGRHYDGASRTTTGPPTNVIQFTLPPLPRGTVYGLTWQSVGPDGHRVAGEIVVGVGYVSARDVTLASFRSVGAVERTMDVLGGVGRFVWYVGLSLSIGALYGLWWLSRSPGSGSGTTASARFARVTRRVLAAGLWVALAGAAVRWVDAIAVRLGSLDTQDGLLRRLFVAMGPASVRMGSLALSTLAFAVYLSRALPMDSELPRQRGRERRLALGIAAALVLATLMLSVAGHPLGERVPALAVPLAAAHVLAAALWFGPLVLVAAFAAMPQGSSGDREEGLAVRRGYLRSYAPLACLCFAVLVATGLRALRANIGLGLFDNLYGTTIAVKLALVAAVLLPLGLYHDRSVRRRQERLRTRGFVRGIRVEAAALTLVLGLASALTVLDPTAGKTERDSAPDLLATQPVADLSTCRTLAVGTRTCYRDYFAALMRRRGAGVAVARVEELSASDPYLAIECHQVVHDLGNDAVKHYKSLAKALAVRGSACASGYYHGVVEEALAGYDDVQLRAAIPSVCAPAAAREYSADHFSCLHGVGHGIMLRFKADLWRSLPYCDALANEWQVNSCLGGVFMENIEAAREGHVKGTFDGGDPMFPCTAVARGQKEQCYGIHTAYLLLKNDRNYGTVFELCDAAEPDFIGTCYQSMGRDIGGAYNSEAMAVARTCDLGQPLFRERCIVGATLNAVYADHNTVKADLLCSVVASEYAAACRAARDRIAATL